ncbi:MAG: hypothetical protein HY330_01575 [Chloroflexi bacterium]|nr:hypothetical protein [Chloroflexota bacterium]
MNKRVFYFKQGTLVTLSPDDNQCWFFANWDTTAPFEIIPLFPTTIQLQLDRDRRIVAYFGKTANYYNKPICNQNRKNPAPTATPPLGSNTPPFIPPPGAVKLEVVIHPVDTKGRGERKGTGYYFGAPTVGVAPRSLDPRPNLLEPPQGLLHYEPGLPLISTTVLYFARDTLVTLVVQDTQCWFFANWDTTAPFEVIPRLPTIYELYQTKIQMRLDRDIKITAYFGKTADYYRSDLTPPCVRE